MIINEGYYGVFETQNGPFFRTHNNYILNKEQTLIKQKDMIYRKSKDFLQKHKTKQSLFSEHKTRKIHNALTNTYRVHELKVWNKLIFPLINDQPQ